MPFQDSCPCVLTVSLAERPAVASGMLTSVVQAELAKCSGVVPLNACTTVLEGSEYLQGGDRPCACPRWRRRGILPIPALVHRRE
jgi:hypothetical protein